MIRRQMHPIYGTLCYGKRFISARFPFFYEYGSGTVRCMAVACCSSPVIVGDGVEGLPVICKGANVCLTVYLSLIFIVHFSFVVVSLFFLCRQNEANERCVPY